MVARFTAARALALAIVVGFAAAPSGRAQSPVIPDVVYVPTPQPVVDAMLALAQVKASDVVYDLGSGDGRIVITAAKKYGARGVGIEIDPALVKKATENAAAAGVVGSRAVRRRRISSRRTSARPPS